MQCKNNKKLNIQILDQEYIICSWINLISKL